MGGSTIDASDLHAYRAYSSTASVRSATTASAVSSTKLHPDVDPKNFKFRESRDSAGNPNSTPVLIGLDGTGSMGDIALKIHQSGLGVLIEEILKRKPVTDPHVAFACIGDVTSDTAALQVTQFESNIVMLDELKKLWMEGNGGGNGWESYNLPWHFALTRTQCDAFAKGRKGILITIGDEEVPHDLTHDQLVKIYGPGEHLALDNKALLEGLAKNWHVFHLMIEQGSHMRYAGDAVIKQWRELLGQRAVLVSDYTKLSEVIISLMEAVQGKDVKDIAKSWSGDTSVVVARALDGLDSALAVPAAAESLVRFGA